MQCVKIYKDLERKLSKTHNLDLASKVREKNITCPVNIVVLGINTTLTDPSSFLPTMYRVRGHFPSYIKLGFLI